MVLDPAMTSTDEGVARLNQQLALEPDLAVPGPRDLDPFDFVATYFVCCESH